MQVIISGKHLDIGNSLREYIKSSIEKNVKKYFQRAIDAHVTISKQGHIFESTVMVNEGTGNGVVIKGNGAEFDAYQSIDTAINRIEAQLHKYKSRIQDHHKKVSHHSEARKYTIQPFLNDEELDTDKYPVVVAEQTTLLQHLSVNDAVMKMDLMNIPALMFINASNNRMSLVYYRKDGNIAWVDTDVSVS